MSLLSIAHGCPNFFRSVCVIQLNFIYRSKFIYSISHIIPLYEESEDRYAEKVNLFTLLAILFHCMKSLRIDMQKDGQHMLTGY